MTIYFKVLALIYSLLFFIIFYKLNIKRAVKPFYSFLWIVIALFMISFVVFENFYKWIATIMGITDASFLIIVGLISFLFIYVLYLSIKISEMGDRIQELISHSSILEHEIRKIKEK